jgi:hypothetical protein
MIDSFSVSSTGSGGFGEVLCESTLGSEKNELSCGYT